MPNIAVCPDCDRELKIPQGAEGRKIRCPSCKTTLLVSDGELSLVGDKGIDVRAGRLERRSRPDDDEDDAPIRRSRHSDPDDEGDEYDRPGKRRKRSGRGIPLWAWLTGGGVLVVAVLSLVLVLLLNKGVGYEKVQTGMKEEEVIGILGKPTDSVTLGKRKVLSWQKSSERITVVLVEGKVSEKTMVDLNEGKFDLDGQDVDFGGGNGFTGERSGRP